MEELEEAWPEDAPLSPPSSLPLSAPSAPPSFSGICLSLLAATNQLGLINICLNVACFRSKINCHWFNIWGVYAITVNVAFAVWKGVVHHTFLLSSQAMVMQAVLSKEANYQEGGIISQLCALVNYHNKDSPLPFWQAQSNQLCCSCTLCWKW